MAASRTLALPIAPRGLRARPELAVAAAALLLAATVVLALGAGAVSIRPLSVIDAMVTASGLSDGLGHATAVEHSIVANVRLPRVLLGVFAGGILALAGMMMQAFFRNPLADPALIGVSAGGALGAVTTIVLGSVLLGGLPLAATQFALPVSAFLGSLGACLLVLALSRRGGTVNATTMLLCGIAVNAMAGAGIGFLTFMADDAQLRDLTFWSLGTLSAASWWQVQAVAPCALVMVVAAPLLIPGLNALLLGDAEAGFLGHRVEVLKAGILLLTCIGAGAVVATCGVIGFAGLVAPHAARLMVGPDHRRALPLAVLLGAVLLLGADMVARTAVAPSEMPIGVLTALIGGPAFLWLLRTRRGGESDD